MADKEQDNENVDFIFKIIIIGDSAVGKTNILSRFHKNEFSHEYKCTVAVDFVNVNISLHNQAIKIQFWDTAG